MNSLRVSVVIPSYNRAALVGETIENMLRQTLPPHEVIVVDDGSTDNSVEVIKAFGDRVRLIQQPNRGPGAARNAGFAVATCDYIQFMDSDDLASLNKLEVQAEALRSQQADLAYGPWIQLSLTQRTVSQMKDVLQPAPVPAELSLCEWHLRGWTPVLQNCLFTRSFLNRLGPLKEDLLGTEDYEFLNRIFLAKPKVAFTPDCAVFYRLHDAGKLSGSGTTSPQKLEHLARAVGYIHANLGHETGALKSGTRFIFGWRAWQLWREMSATGGFSPERMEQTRQIFTGYPAVAFRAFGVWSRVATAVRGRLTGNTWLPPYRARRIGTHELDLMREAGLTFDAKEISQPAVSAESQKKYRDVQSDV